jgi:hypothetical protein
MKQTVRLLHYSPYANREDIIKNGLRLDKAKIRPDEWFTADGVKTFLWASPYTDDYLEKHDSDKNDLWEINGDLDTGYVSDYTETPGNYQTQEDLDAFIDGIYEDWDDQSKEEYDRDSVKDDWDVGIYENVPPEMLKLVKKAKIEEILNKGVLPKWS